MIALILLGANGRMGVAVDRAAADAADVRIKARIDRAAVPAAAGGPASGGAASQPAGPGDVVVDFSSPEGTLAACRLCEDSGAALVTGTTGLGESHEAALARLAERRAVLRSANFSLGVLALRRAVRAALASLPPGWDVEIVERHHRGKADAPSGTALALARDVTGLRGWTDDAFRHGRAGHTGARTDHELGLHAVRGGTWVGDHTVLIAGEGEWLELRHVAQDRSAFAHGVLAAVRFVARAAPGIYHLEDVVTGSHI